MVGFTFNRSTKITCLTIIVFLMFLYGINLYSSDYRDKRVNSVKFRFVGGGSRINSNSLRMLVEIKPGDRYDQNKIRNSLQNLYNVGYFYDIKAKAVILSEKLIDIIFEIQNKFKIGKIKINKLYGINSNDLRKSIFSVRRNIFFKESKVLKAVDEIKNFMKSRGYFNTIVKYKIKMKKLRVIIYFEIIRGVRTLLNNVFVTGDDKGILKNSDEIFKWKNYIPDKFSMKIRRLEKDLKDAGYFFPKINIKEVFLDKTRRNVNVYINVNPGYEYKINIVGIKKKFEFVTDIWKKKVREKWAERESKVRIIAYLRNKGLLNAEVKSTIETKGDQKFITFTIKKNTRFVLGKIKFEGNRIIPTKILRDVITVDDLIFDRIFHLRMNSIRVDAEVLKWFYYYKGFPFVKIRTTLKFKKKSVTLKYIIDEGEQFTVDSILFGGNTKINSIVLNSILKTKPSKPFVMKRLNEDVEALKSFYFKNGFDKVHIETEISSGSKKAILIKITEGRSYKFGDLIIVGASRDQNSLIKRLFPLKKGEPFNKLMIESFKNEISRTSIFTEVKILKIENNGIVSVLLAVEQNKSKYLGFGIGYQERTGIRFTFEYQKRNFFKSYSTFSALVQIGLKEKRGEISYETPYLFGTSISSSLKIWEENELYRSYKFNRYGISESLVQRLTNNSYVLSSISWYRTKLLELNVDTSSGIDIVGTPYDITAINFSYVKDKRDNPFLPTKGSFFSTDVKIAMPLFNSDFSFVRFRWGYQRSTKFLKNGVFTFSIRNGFATNNVPITERFFGGGSSTFRGTGNDKLGSLDKKSGEPYGGNSLILFNFEVTFPLYIIPMDDLYYSLFADFGNIYRYSNEFSMENLQKAIGFGIRIKSSIGLISFDVAYNIERREGVSPVAFHIGIGNAF